MSEYHFPVPGSVDESKIVLFVRKHWAAFLGQALLILVLIIIPIILFTILYFRDSSLFHGLFQNFLVLGLSVYFLIIATFSFTAWMTFYFDIYIITTDSIIDVKQQGFFGRKISQLSLLRVQDTTSNIAGLMATFFGYGTVLVETAGEQTQNFLLETIPNPQEVSAKIQELHNKLIEVEGRHHQLLEGEGTLAPGKITGQGGHEHPEQQGSASAPSSSAPPEEPPPPIPPVESEAQPTPTYQELLEKEKNTVQVPPSPEPQPPAASTTPPAPPASETGEGQVSHEDLDKGGEIKL